MTNVAAASAKWRWNTCVSCEGRELSCVLYVGMARRHNWSDLAVGVQSTNDLPVAAQPLHALCRERFVLLLMVICTCTVLTPNAHMIATFSSAYAAFAITPLTPPDRASTVQETTFLQAGEEFRF